MFRVRLSIGAMWLVVVGGIALAALLVVGMLDPPTEVADTRPAPPAAAPVADTPECQARRTELIAAETALDKGQRRSRAAIDALRKEAAALDVDIARLKKDWARLEQMLSEITITKARVEPLRQSLQTAVATRQALDGRIASHEAALAGSERAVAAARLQVRQTCTR